MVDTPRFTRRQERFIAEYVQCLNATQAAINSGYSKATAYSAGSRLLKEGRVAAEINHILDNKNAHLIRQESALRITTYARSTHVYLIQAENGLVKIGKTTDVQKRLAALDVGSPVDLKLIAQKQDLFASDLETRLHQEYAHRRVKGEWFNLSKMEIEQIVNDYGFNT